VFIEISGISGGKMAGAFISTFLRQSRAMFLTCTVVPVTLGGILAYRELGGFGPLEWLLFALNLFGVSAAHLGVNLANDFFDFKQGADKVETWERRFSGGSGSITQEGVAPEKIRLMFWACFIVALGFGLTILALIEQGRLLVLSIMILGFLGGYFYTAPPLRLAYRGLGELDIFLFLGPAPVLGTYAVIAGRITLEAFACSLPVAGLITALLWINEYTDYETDKEAGKKNLIVRLGRKNARWGYLALVFYVFAAMIVPVALGLIEPTFLIALLPLPIAIRSVKRAFTHFNDPEKITLAQADFLKVHLFAGLLCSVGVAAGLLL
jgi:1,4-dihydroxy-2-naphthoate polyprenyltransferase